MRFSELLNYADHAGAGFAGPGNAQREARRRFPAVAREHGQVVGGAGRPRPRPGTHVVIGVAAGYAVLDLELLDDLSAALRARSDERIELLDSSGSEHGADLESLVPGSISTGQTPIVAVWDAGRLVRAEAGKAARDFLRSKYLGRA
jgi:hypothetical protein